MKTARSSVMNSRIRTSAERWWRNAPAKCKARSTTSRRRNSLVRRMPMYAGGLGLNRGRNPGSGGKTGRGRRHRGQSASIKWIVPLHASEISAILGRSKNVILVENNQSGQFARYLRSETGFDAHGHIRKYDGEPFMPHHIVEAVKDAIGRQDPPFRSCP